MTRKSLKDQDTQSHRNSRTEQALKSRAVQAFIADQSPLEVAAERMLDPYWAWRAARS